MGREMLDRRRLFGLAAGAALSAPSLTLAQGDTPNPQGPMYDPNVGIGAGDDLYSRLTAPVSLNEQGPYDFVIDTGANHSVIAAGDAIT